MGGFFKLQHGILDYYMFKDEPYTEREAWIWLIDSASFEPHKIRYQSKVIEVCRGQVPASLRKLKEKWKWGINRIRNFLDLLETQGMISVKSDTGFSIITICNYSKYQGALRKADTHPDTPADTGSDTDTDTNISNIRTKEIKKDIPKGISQKVCDEFSETEFEEFWSQYGRIGNKEPARKSFEKARKEASYATIINGLKRYQAYCRAIGAEQRYIKHAATWLNQRGWQDEYAIVTPAAQKSKHQRAKEALGLA